MTDPTGRSFLSYRRARKGEAALLIAAQHDHGIPTWQDIHNLGSVPTEDEIRRVLADPSTASAVLFVTPDAQCRGAQNYSTGGGRRQLLCCAAGCGWLNYTRAAELTSNHLSAQNIADWNMHKVPASILSPGQAAEFARRVLVQRMQAIHRYLPQGHCLRVGLFIRRAPAFELGTALALNWSSCFIEKETIAETWQETLLPALARVVEVIRQHAPGRDVEAFGLPTLPAALAFGCAFLSTSGLRASWRQITPGHPDQLWTLAEPRGDSAFNPNIMGKDANACDIAVLVSIADNTEPLFAAYQKNLPPLRALVQVTKPGPYPHLIRLPGEATDIALAVQDGMRTARREYGSIGTVHLFMAAPAGIAVLVGQLLNTLGAVQTYEHLSIDGSGCYKPAALLRPCV